LKLHKQIQILEMKIIRNIILLLFFTFQCAPPLVCQSSINPPERSTEQEALSQTEKMQKELNLSAEQTRQIYEINLRYAHLRQKSNSRAEAMERIKLKNAEIQQKLTESQRQKLMNKQYERSSNFSGKVIIR